MMRFHCPFCNKRLKAVPTDAGKRATFPTCQGKLIVPDPDTGIKSDEIDLSSSLPVVTKLQPELQPKQPAKAEDKSKRNRMS